VASEDATVAVNVTSWLMVGVVVEAASVVVVEVRLDDVQVSVTVLEVLVA
jgi:hypothetical protein